jgi:hypothetical protein
VALTASVAPWSRPPPWWWRPRRPSELPRLRAGRLRRGGAARGHPLERPGRDGVHPLPPLLGDVRPPRPALPVGRARPRGRPPGLGGAPLPDRSPRPALGPQARAPGLVAAAGGLLPGPARAVAQGGGRAVRRPVPARRAARPREEPSARPLLAGRDHRLRHRHARLHRAPDPGRLGGRCSPPAPGRGRSGPARPRK